MKSKMLTITVAMLLLALVGCSDEAMQEDSRENVVTEEIAKEDEVTEDTATEDTAAEEMMTIDEDTVEADAATCPYEANPQFIFSTSDIDGNAVSIEDYSDSKLILVNFWEPWCGPCVGEMPDLEELYEEYSDKDVTFLGIFSTLDMEEEAREVMEECGTSYPVLKYVDAMEPFTTDYVPTTIFLDGHGHVISDEPIIVSKSYEDWKPIIEEYLNK